MLILLPMSRRIEILNLYFFDSWIFITAVSLIIIYFSSSSRLTRWSAEEAKAKSRTPRDAWDSRHLRWPKAVAVRKARRAYPFFGPLECYQSWSAWYRNHHRCWWNHLPPKRPLVLACRCCCSFFYLSLLASCAA